ncbi:hypothetical protein CRG98_035646 [Punica granatum]|uniref:BED-type domain-containing protein n=1 Tax=Punica granatum TaxID=22663 RepID=A0A2I0IJV1_PUNGR|nr:hypothetical protein CRG98_035646 [Punica granatum]
MGKPRDKFWDYAEVIPNEGEGKDKGTRWKCKFCNKKYSGGASRIKAHLAKVDREGIKVCEAVDEATTKEALEALDSNKRPKKKKRPDYLTDSTPMNPQEADLQSTLPVLGQRNLNGQLQRRPDEIQRVEFSGENESIDLANIPTRSDFGESTVGAMMQEFENEIQVEGPSDAQGYVNDWSGRERMLAPKLVGRDRIVDELWGYLTTNDILRIGVYGMGGVGKTTTMKHLYNKVHGSAAFENGVIYEDRRRKMYNEGHRLLDELEKSCLLEACSDGNGSKAVRIHDVIRDMALHIMNANNPPCMVKSGLGLEDVPDDEEWLLNLQKVSLMSNGIEAVPPSISPNCPQLATLLLSDCKRLHKISKRFFRRMQGLKVIDLRYTSITKVPKSVMSLKKLRALVLKCCFQLSRIPSLAKLTSLGKLDIEGCRKIKEVPDGLGMLVNLTYLGIHVSGIERIPDGVVCKLKKLQHLRADYVTVKGGEVGKLRKLEVLRCRFENVNELNEYTRHATTIESYILVIGGHPNCSYALNSGKVVIMDDVEIRETCQFPRDVKFLWILRVRTWNISSFTGLEELEVLRTEELLEEPEGQQEERTSPPPPGDHCPNLKVLQILDCPKLKHLLVSRHHCYLHLKKLEKLEIYHCEELESMIGAATDEEESLTSSTPPLPPDAFSQLQLIKLRWCHKMKRVLTLESFMLLPNLEKLEIDRCEELESMIGAATDEEESLTSSTPPLPPDAFSQLQSIKIAGCPKMKDMVGPKSLPVLRKIELSGCAKMKRMKEVIGGQELDHGATSSLFLSPIPAASPGDQLSTRKLTLKLDDLEELESICSWTGLRDLIHVIQISRCPELKRIEMLDDASPPPSLKEIVLWVGGDGNRAKQWWESLEWEHPDAKNILEPYVFVDTPHRKKIPLRECRP